MGEEWAVAEWQSQEVGKRWLESFDIFHMDFGLDWFWAKKKKYED